jgi:hypothetical protein
MKRPAKPIETDLPRARTRKPKNKPRVSRPKKALQYGPDAWSPAQYAYLEQIARGMPVTTACKLVGIDPNQIFDLRKVDPLFVQAEREAERRGVDTMVTEIVRRGQFGYDEPVIFKGQLMMKSDGTPLTVRKYSDRLLEKLAEARDPEHFARGLTVRGDKNAPLDINIGSLKTSQLEQLVERLAEAIASRKDGDGQG